MRTAYVTSIHKSVKPISTELESDAEKIRKQKGN